MNRLPYIAILFAILCYSCSSRPDDVLSHDRMVELMTDIHKGEAYVESNYGNFQTDSSKMVMRQSVLLKHGVTAQQFDSSLMWYGRNTEELSELYAQVIENLENQMNNMGTSYAASTSFAGDSVNAWTESPFYILNANSPSTLLNFTLNSDENWQPGDSYTWQFKTVNYRSTTPIAMYIDYDDGMTEMITSETRHDGWQRITIISDSLRNPVSVYGYTNFDITGKESIFLDSVSLIRKRRQPELYRQRFRQRSFKYGITKPSVTQNGTSPFISTNTDK